MREGAMRQSGCFARPAPRGVLTAGEELAIFDAAMELPAGSKGLVTYVAARDHPIRTLRTVSSTVGPQRREVLPP
ncbi:hypothetical protein Misp04_50850 [Micromonospora sp. NBRC 101691]|nr:hypothetical protein Misp04_50850 [Micromonospora sp. NBRC 101691]